MCGNECGGRPLQGHGHGTGGDRFYIPKSLGCYECELHEVVKQIVESSPQLVIDVGCGEGYYLVGLAIRLPNAVLVGFNTDPAARLACGEQAAINHVDSRISVHGECSPATLSQWLQDGALVIVDCEGYESTLLDPGECPRLKTARYL